MRQSEMFWETQGEEINQTRQKGRQLPSSTAHGQHCLGRLAMPRTALWRGPNPQSVHRSSHTRSNLLASPQQKRQQDPVIMGWVQLSHSDCFAVRCSEKRFETTRFPGILEALLPVHVSESSMHRVCGIPYKVQRSQPHSY